MLSARAVMSYTAESDGVWTFHLSPAATEKCKVAALHEQDGNALFFQAMRELREGEYEETKTGSVITDLSDIISTGTLTASLTAEHEEKDRPPEEGGGRCFGRRVSA